MPLLSTFQVLYSTMNAAARSGMDEGFSLTSLLSPSALAGLAGISGFAVRSRRLCPAYFVFDAFLRVETEKE